MGVQDIWEGKDKRDFDPDMVRSKVKDGNKDARECAVSTEAIISVIGIGTPIHANRVTIKHLIGEPALLEQLAEEATELAKAALKKARILRGENPTPVTLEKAGADLMEEFTDVIQCARELGITPDEQQIINKDIRWLNRIREAGNHE